MEKSRRISFHNGCRVSESSGSGVIQPGNQLPRAGAAKARDPGNPREFSAANAEKSHGALNSL